MEYMPIPRGGFIGVNGAAAPWQSHESVWLFSTRTRLYEVSIKPPETGKSLVDLSSFSSFLVTSGVVLLHLPQPTSAHWAGSPERDISSEGPQRSGPCLPAAGPKEGSVESTQTGRCVGAL